MYINDRLIALNILQSKNGLSKWYLLDQNQIPEQLLFAFFCLHDHQNELKQ